MRTTLDLPDPLFRKAKKLASDRGIPFRAVVAEGLRLLLEGQAPAGAFKLRDASFGKGGLTGDLSESQWERIRDLAYEGRG